MRTRVVQTGSPKRRSFSSPISLPQKIEIKRFISFRRNPLHHIVRNILCSFHSCERWFHCLIAKNRNWKFIRTTPRVLNLRVLSLLNAQLITKIDVSTLHDFPPLGWLRSYRKSYKKSARFILSERLFNNQKDLFLSAKIVFARHSYLI